MTRTVSRLEFFNTEPSQLSADELYERAMAPLGPRELVRQFAGRWIADMRFAGRIMGNMPESRMRYHADADRHAVDRDILDVRLGGREGWPQQAMEELRARMSHLDTDRLNQRQQTLLRTVDDELRFRDERGDPDLVDAHRHVDDMSSAIYYQTLAPFTRQDVRLFQKQLGMNPTQAFISSPLNRRSDQLRSERLIEHIVAQRIESAAGRPLAGMSERTLRQLIEIHAERQQELRERGIEVPLHEQLTERALQTIVGSELWDRQQASAGA